MAQQSATYSSQGRMSGARKRAIREAATGYLFIAPATILLTVFGLFPLLYAVYISLHRWRIKKGPFLGFKNYTKALGDPKDILWFAIGIALLVGSWYLWKSMTRERRTWAMVAKLLAVIVFIAGAWGAFTGMGKMIESGDQKMFEAFVVTIFYAVGIVPMQLGLALLLAVMLYQKIKGKDLYRMIYFMPYVTITVASAGVFRAIFSRRPESIANQIVGWIGVAPQKWLQEPHGIWELIFGHFGVNLQEVFKSMGVDSFVAFILAGPSLALLSIMLYNLWVFVGYNSVIFLAGLGAIPSDLYEAAEIDGANRWHIFRYVTLPLLSPTIYFLTIITVMGVFKAINHVLVMREPAAQGTVDTASLYIFDQFYLSTRFGYASAIAMVLFLVILTLTFIQNRIAQRRVFYG